MSNFSGRLMDPAFAPSSSAEAFAFGSTTRGQITWAYARNDDASDRVLTLYLVPSGGSADSTTKIDDFTLLAGEGRNLYEVIGAKFNGGDALHWEADAASVVNLHVHGQKYTEG